MNIYEKAQNWAEELTEGFQRNAAALNHILDNHFNLSRSQLLSRFEIEGRKYATIFEAKYFSEIEPLIVDALADEFEDVMVWSLSKQGGTMYAFSWDCDCEIGHGYKRDGYTGKVYAVKCGKLRIALCKDSNRNIYISSVYPCCY